MNNRTSTLGMVPAKIACPSTSYSRMCQKSEHITMQFDGENK
jgi:hypothetical protein